MSKEYETPQELLAGGVQGLQIAEAIFYHPQSNMLAQLMAVKIAYGAADMFEKGAGELVASAIGLNHPDVTAEDEARVQQMTHEDVLSAAPEAVMAINGLVETLGPFARAMLMYVKSETARRYGSPDANT